MLRALSDIATVGILQERLLNDWPSQASGLHAALAGRIHIEQAKGILAERNGIQTDDAFERLRTHARANRLRLAAVATAVIDRAIDL